MDKNLLQQHIIAGCEAAHIQINQSCIDRLVIFFNLVYQGNKRMNLTRIDSTKDVAIKHFVDSLLLTKTDSKFSGTGIDIGSGAGFPGIVLAICKTTYPVILLDSSEKKVKFLQFVVDQLGLTHVQCIHNRAEDLGRSPKFRENCEWAVARAVAPLSTLVEYSSPFVKVGGHFLAMKGRSGDQELKSAQAAINTVNLELVNEYRYKLPYDYGKRIILDFRKKAPIALKFPRKAGIPHKKPL